MTSDSKYGLFVVYFFVVVVVVVLFVGYFCGWFVGFVVLFAGVLVWLFGGGWKEGKDLVCLVLNSFL